VDLGKPNLIISYQRSTTEKEVFMKVCPVYKFVTGNKDVKAAALIKGFQISEAWICSAVSFGNGRSISILLHSSPFDFG
jgi:hypothetical protein